MSRLAEDTKPASQSRKRHHKGGKTGKGNPKEADFAAVDDILSPAPAQGDTRTKKWVRRAAWMWSLYTLFFAFIPQNRNQILSSYLLWIPFTAIACYRGTLSIEDASLPVYVTSAISQSRASEVIAMTMATEGPIGMIIGMGVMSQIVEEPTQVYIPIAAGLLRMGISSWMDASMSRYEINLAAVALAATLTLFTGALWQIILISGIVALVPAAYYANKIAVMLRLRGRPNKNALNRLGMQSLASFLVTGLAVFTALTVTNNGFSEIFVVAANSGFLIPYWILCLAVTFLVCYFSLDYLNVNFRRKIFHLCIVAMFAPFSHKEFTKPALAMAIVLFAFAELSRCSGNPLFASQIQAVCKPFFDTRDQTGSLVLSHLSLLAGAALPVFLGDGSPVGVIAIGLGDTAASIFGQLAEGKPIFGTKTHEGVLGFIVATFVGLYLCGYHERCAPVLLAAIVSGYLEATTLLNDNFVIPAYMFASEMLTKDYIDAAHEFAKKRRQGLL